MDELPLINMPYKYSFKEGEIITIIGDNLSGMASFIKEENGKIYFSVENRVFAFDVNYVKAMKTN